MPEDSNLPSTDSKPLRERLLPQTSIRFLMFVIVLSAIVMLIFREAVAGRMWAKIVALLIQTAGASFIAYIGMFLIANVFSVTTEPLIEAIESKIDDSHGDQT